MVTSLYIMVFLLSTSYFKPEKLGNDPLSSKERLYLFEYS